MDCSFCGSPAAHPATGCQYGPHTIACRACVESFWVWLRAHTNKRPRKGHGVPTALTFYEAATLFARADAADQEREGHDPMTRGPTERP